VSNPGEQRRGLLLLLGAAFSFSVMSALVKLAGRDLPLGMAVFARCAVTLVLSYAMVRWQGLPARGNDQKLLVLRGLFGLGGLVCFFYAVMQLPIAEATVIHFLNPVLTTVLAATVLRERAGLSVSAALALGLCGTILVARPAGVFGHGAALDHLGVAAALGGAAFSACAYVTVRKVTRTDHPDVVALYFPIVATPATFAFALASWTWPTPRGWLLLCGIGCATHMGQILLTRGLALVPVGRGTTIGYAQIAFAALWGTVFFAERPSPWTLAGAALIVGAALLTFRAPAQDSGSR
jgi:drug/metabolite transporter (DMT)-like permease